ncbi:MAG: NADH-quinone oxidoreductase subunit H [Methanobacteriaceae archaeon]
MNIAYSMIGVLGTLVVAFIVSLLLPGIERKFIHARIQQRVGPPITSPGIMAPIKFFFKQTINPESPMPRLYNALPIISLFVVLVLLLFLIPEMYFLGAITSVIAIVGFLKVEEVMYMFMGSLSKSVLSVRMPFPDIVKGAKHPETPRTFVEELSTLRAFRMIAFGSFPVYIALFVSVAVTGSIYLSDIVAYQQAHGPILFTVAGALGAVVFFIGYMILLNEYPFAILKTKADVIEGPYLEYAAKYRSFVYLTRGFLMFVLASLFATLFLGIAPNILNPSFIITLIVALLFPMIMAVMSAFSPIFTYKQFYPTVAATSILGVLAIVAAFL